MTAQTGSCRAVVPLRTELSLTVGPVPRLAFGILGFLLCVICEICGLLLVDAEPRLQLRNLLSNHRPGRMFKTARPDVARRGNIEKDHRAGVGLRRRQQALWRSPQL